MDSFVLSKKTLLKKTLVVSVFLIFITGFATYYFSKDDLTTTSWGHTIFEASYFLLFISLFLFVATLISMVVIRLLEAIGFWHK